MRPNFLQQTVQNEPGNTRSPAPGVSEPSGSDAIRENVGSDTMDSNERQQPEQHQQQQQQQPRPHLKTSPQMKLRRKMLRVTPHRFTGSRNAMAGLAMNKHARTSLKAPQGRNVRPHVRIRRPPPPSPSQKAHKELKDLSYDELTGLPSNLESGNGASNGVSSITALSEPPPPPSTVTVDTGADATEVGEVAPHDTGGSVKNTVPKSDESNDKEKMGGSEHLDANGGGGGGGGGGGVRDLLGGLDGGDAGGAGNLDSISKYLQADNILRDKLNKDSGGGGGGGGGGEQKGGSLSDVDISVGPMDAGGDGGGAAQSGGGGGGSQGGGEYGDEGMKPIDIGG